jgi:hypothetical protein
MRRACATEREQDEIPRVESLFDSRLADDVSHLELGDPGDATGGLHQCQLQRIGDASHRRDGSLGVKPNATA